MLPIMEHFYTIQGEGVHQGKAAYFIRLGGCDVGCTWCDVKESWDAEQHPKKNIADLLQEANQFPGRLVVITGGEPLMHDLSELTQEFQQAGFRTHIETSGAHPLSGFWDWICLSPKKFKLPLDDCYQKAHELKIIVFNKHDLIWAQEQAAKVNDNCTLLLQPEWSKEQKMLPLIINFVKENPKWRISLQTHKYINVP